MKILPLLALLSVPFVAHAVDAILQQHAHVRHSYKLPPGPLWKIPGFPHPRGVIPPPAIIVQPLGSLES